MTKTDYIAVAQAIKIESLMQIPYKTAMESSSNLTCIRSLTDRMVAIFTADNPRFDGERFLQACGF